MVVLCLCAAGIRLISGTWFWIISLVLMDMEASFALWKVQVHAYKPSTYVLTPPKSGALREVARYNILLLGTLL